MIRLLQSAFLPATRSLLLPLIQFPYFSKKNKGQQSSKRREEKEANNRRINFGEHDCKKKQKEAGSKQEVKKEKGEKDYKNRNKNYKMRWNMPSLIDPAVSKMLQAELSTPNHKFNLLEEWKRCASFNDYYKYAEAMFTLLRKMLPVLVDLSKEISPDLVHAFMEGYFCSYLSLLRPIEYNHHLHVVEFFIKNQPHIETFYAKAPIKQQLRFYAIIKDLTVRRAGQLKFRDLVSKYHFIYRPLLQSMQKVDFSSMEGEEILEIFGKSLKNHPLNSEDDKLVNCICSQVPFFPTDPLFRFLREQGWLLRKADPATVLSILQAIKLQEFKNIRQNQFFFLINVFAFLNLKLPQFTAEIEQILALIFGQLFTSKYPRNLVLELVVELAKYVQLKSGAAGSNELFSFLRSELEAMSLKSEQAARHQANILFEVLSILLYNKFICREHFPDELKTLQTVFERTASRLKFLQKSYLWNLLHGQYGELEVFHAGDILQLSHHKQVEYIHQLIQLNDIQSTKRLMQMLADCRRQPLLLSLKSKLSEYEYQKILTQLNLSLINNDALSFYREIIWELFQHKEFSQIMIDFVDNLHGMEKEGLNQRFLKLLLSVCCQKIDLREAAFRKHIESLLHLFVYYINNLRQAELLLAEPNFYFIVMSMISFLKSKTGTFLEYKINAYRLVSFILSADNPILNYTIEPVIRNLAIKHQDSQRFSSQTNHVDRNIALFKLKFLIPAQEVAGIYDVIVGGNLRPPEAHVTRIHKLYSEKWLPKQINRHTLVAFLMDENVNNILKDYVPAVERIVQEAAVQELAFFIYNFNNNFKVIKSQLFQLLWVAFIEKVQLKHIPHILSFHILGRYINLEDNYFLPFLFKVLEFFGANPGHLSRTMHQCLFFHLRHRFRNVTLYPPLLNNYVASLRKILGQQWSYFSTNHHFLLLKDVMSLGFCLTEPETDRIKDKFLDHEFSFYYCLLSEDSYPDQIQSILKNYLLSRSRRNANDLPAVNYYIKMKYPSLQQYLKGDGVVPSVVLQMSARQQSAINRLHKRYKDLSLWKQLHCLTYENHLIAFHISDKVVLSFLQKLYATQPTTNHFQVHIFDINELNKASAFFAKIEALGIVGARSEKVTETEKNEQDPQQQLMEAFLKFKDSHLQQTPRQ